MSSALPDTAEPLRDKLVVEGPLDTAVFQPDRPGGGEAAAGLRPDSPEVRLDKLTAPDIAEGRADTVEVPVGIAGEGPGTVAALADIAGDSPGTVAAPADTAEALLRTWTGLAVRGGLGRKLLVVPVAGNMRRSAGAPPGVSHPRAGPLGYSPECSRGSRDLSAGPADSWAGFPTSRG